jgi:hypothetical protein
LGDSVNAFEARAATGSAHIIAAGQTLERQLHHIQAVKKLSNQSYVFYKI